MSLGEAMLRQILQGREWLNWAKITTGELCLGGHSKAQVMKQGLMIKLFALYVGSLSYLPGERVSWSK